MVESWPFSMCYHAGCGDTTACSISSAWLKSKGDDFYRSGDYRRLARIEFYILDTEQIVVLAERSD